jgi:hypothetical protein
LLANPNAYSQLFSDENEDMLMMKSLDYKLRARKASANKYDGLKIEKKKARKALMVGGSGSSNHCKLI